MHFDNLIVLIVAQHKAIAWKSIVMNLRTFPMKIILNQMKNRKIHLIIAKVIVVLSMNNFPFKHFCLKPVVPNNTFCYRTAFTS